MNNTAAQRGVTARGGPVPGPVNNRSAQDRTGRGLGQHSRQSRTLLCGQVIHLAWLVLLADGQLCGLLIQQPWLPSH